MAYVGPYVGTIGMVDQHGLRASKQFHIWIDDGVVLTEDARIATARLKMIDLAGHLDNISDLLLTSVSVKWEFLSDVLNLKAAPLDQGAAEGAVVLVYKENTDTLHPYWIPGASAGVFLPDFATVDIADGDLQQFFQEFEDMIGVQVRFSDGENLDTARGDDGVRSGYYATKPRNTRD